VASDLRHGSYAHVAGLTQDLNTDDGGLA